MQTESFPAPKDPRLAKAGCATHIPRSSKDRPDIARGPQVHVLFVIPQEQFDIRYDEGGILACSLEALNAWMKKESGFVWNFDTFRMRDRGGAPAKVTEEVDITYVRSEKDNFSLDSAEKMKTELISLGFDDPRKRYFAFFLGLASSCGSAIYPPLTPHPAPEWVDGKYSMLFLFQPIDLCVPEGEHPFGVPGSPAYLELWTLQQLLHNEGLVFPGAPHACGGSLIHVCTPGLWLTAETRSLDPQRDDVMYPYLTGPLSEKTLDIDNDDYFRHPWAHLLDLEDSPYLVKK